MKILRRLWKDEGGFVVSAELVLVASVAILAMIVGLAAYRDAIIDELADNGKAINALNQSYSIAVPANGVLPAVGPAITVSGTTVTVTRNLDYVTTTATFENFSYIDGADFCATGSISRTNTSQDEDDASPTPTP
jgi:hypothetical protein